MRRTFWSLGFVVASLAAASSACSSAGEEEERGASDSALARPEFDAAVRHLGRLVYLPWGYSENGCYARAFYYSMTLASRGIPSNQLYFIGKKRRGTPGAEPYLIGGYWNYHVAPMVTLDGEAGGVYILDPLFAKTPLTLERWIKTQDPTRTDPNDETFPDVNVFPGSRYQTPYSPGGQRIFDPFAPDEGAVREPTMAAMPAFATGDVNDACTTMHAFIDNEAKKKSGTFPADKHLMLAIETRRLMRDLGERGKMSAGALVASCISPTLPAFPGKCTSASRGDEEMDHGTCVHNGAGWFRCRGEEGNAKWESLDDFVEPGSAQDDPPLHPGCTAICRFGKPCVSSYDADEVLGR